jgi:hypothetical protein
MRIGLGFNADSRDGTLQRDEKLQNWQLNPDGVYKRPGSSRTTYSTTAGAGIGIMTFGTKIYMWTGSMTTTPGNSNL